MIVKFKKLSPLAVIPRYSKPGDAGMDLTATEYEFDEVGNYIFKTGISIEIPDGYVGLIFPRSSISKTNLFLTNAVGVIDSKYRGEIIVKFKSSIRYSTGIVEWIRMLFGHKILKTYKATIVNVQSSTNAPMYKIGDRIAQLIIIPYPQIEFEEVEELSQTDRGTGGFGSSGL